MNFLNDVWLKNSRMLEFLVFEQKYVAFVNETDS